MYVRHVIDSLDLPELGLYRDMRSQADPLALGLFIAEGEKIVRRLLESPHRVVSVLMPSEWEPSFIELLDARPEPIQLYIAPKAVLSAMTGFKLFQGVLGLGVVPPPLTWDELVGLVSPQLFTALDGLTNAVNVGLVARNAAALGIQALVLGETCAHPYLRRSVRSAMGTNFKLPYFLSTDLVNTLRELEKRGIQCVAAHPHVEDRFLPDIDLARPSCIVLGSEGHGVQAQTLEVCSATAAIPMQRGVDSLNVGNASAAFFYEAWRQRFGVR